MLSGLYCTVLALLTLGQLVAVHAAVLTGLKYVAVIVFMVVGLVSAAVPFCGNVILAVMLDRASLLIASQNARRRLNIVIGVALFILAVFFDHVSLA